LRPSNHGSKARGNTRRVFDRSVTFARCRWECLRRTAEYRAEIRTIINAVAKSLRWPPEKLERHCLNDSGIIERGSGEAAASGAYYDAVAARYGLTVLMHPDVAFSEDQMAAFPIFADTPSRQDVVKDPALLRRIARRGGEITVRLQRRIFRREQLPLGPFQLPVERINFARFDLSIRVFDARVNEEAKFSKIAEKEMQTVDQVKRGWRLARRLIVRWLDLDNHIQSCAECQTALSRNADRYCDAAERQIRVRGTRGPRLYPMTDKQLALLHGSRNGELPARSAWRKPGAPGWK
jgi:hypothetical protein